MALVSAGRDFDNLRAGVIFLSASRLSITCNECCGQPLAGGASGHGSGVLGGVSGEPTACLSINNEEAL